MSSPRFYAVLGGALGESLRVDAAFIARGGMDEQRWKAGEVRTQWEAAGEHDAGRRDWRDFRSTVSSEPSSRVQEFEGVRTWLSPRSRSCHRLAVGLGCRAD